MKIGSSGKHSLPEVSSSGLRDSMVLDKYRLRQA